MCSRTGTLGVIVSCCRIRISRSKVISTWRSSMARCCASSDGSAGATEGRTAVLLPFHPATPFLQKEKINARLTASFGLSSYPEDARDKRELMAAADRCLFESKSAGKDRITPEQGASLSGRDGVLSVPFRGITQAAFMGRIFHSKNRGEHSKFKS